MQNNRVFAGFLEGELDYPMSYKYMTFKEKLKFNVAKNRAGK